MSGGRITISPTSPKNTKETFLKIKFNCMKTWYSPNSKAEKGEPEYIVPLNSVINENQLEDSVTNNKRITSNQTRRTH